MALSRRDFLHGLAATPAALWLPGIGMRAHSPNEEIRVAVIGIRSRGQAHINGLHSIDGVRVVALCDADAKVLAREAKKFADRGEKVDTHRDLREIMDRDDIDVVSTATPNHWHALISVWACQSGKDVYVEKPVSHNVWEGRQIVKAARKYGRIVQTGTQCRSSYGVAEAVAWVQAGNLGKIKAARGFCYKPRRSIGKVKGPRHIGGHIDYDLWTGPAPMKPLVRKKLHYDWHWVTDTGNGDLGNQGIHQMDIARWFLGEKALSPRVMSVGDRLGYDDDGNTPNTQIVLHDYPTAPLIFEVRGLPKNLAERKSTWKMDRYRGVGIGVIIDCEGGSVFVKDYSSATAHDKNGEVIQQWKGAKNHFANFIDAVRDRKRTTLSADILEGHISSALCHTGNISHELGRLATRSEIRDTVSNHAIMAEAFERFDGHLMANSIDIDKTPVHVGPWLEMNPATEQFKNNAPADALLARPGRRRFRMPSEV